MWECGQPMYLSLRLSGKCVDCDWKGRSPYVFFFSLGDHNIKVCLVACV